MSIYDSLNPQQQEAVQHYEGPLLILAGAGSGKTRVLTHRVAWLIEERGVNPWNILAITFTNKAAGEMRERVERILSRPRTEDAPIGSGGFDAASGAFGYLADSAGAAGVSGYPADAAGAAGASGYPADAAGVAGVSGELAAATGSSGETVGAAGSMGFSGGQSAKAAQDGDGFSDRNGARGFTGRQSPAAPVSAVWVSTFHSTCVRILRRYIDRIGYGNHFTIYDADDQKSVVRDICKLLKIDTKQHKERTFMNIISSAKDEMVTPEEYASRAEVLDDYNMKLAAKVYTEYQKQLRTSNALDFDDLLCKTVELFQTCPEVLDSYQERFRFIMVDEYQDTNTVQFQLISLLASKYRNLCVVGDDDQSIYKFRGANIGNILNFEEFFPDAKVIRLEQNYRSTQNILDAANSVIKKNVGRKEKTLWTANGEGAHIHFRQLATGYGEADYVTDRICTMVNQGKADYKDFAVLYRTNAQSRLFEEKFLLANISYKIVGGIQFYARKEIKDVLAYLKTIDNAEDDLAVRRIINVPRRKIGAATIAHVQEYALREGISFYRALGEAGEITSISRPARTKLLDFVQMIQTFRSKAEQYSVRQLIEDILEVTGYSKELELEGGEEAKERQENIDELLNKAASYDENAETPSLSGFLEEVALVADIDEVSDDTNQVLMMTLHSAKGLEFPVVFLTGMEDGMFPSYMSITSDDETDLEEERRLCYVGITRAQKELFLTAARQRMVRGDVHFNRVSRFVEDIPEELLLDTSVYRGTPAKNSGAASGGEGTGAAFGPAGGDVSGSFGSGSRASDGSSGSAGGSAGGASGSGGRKGGVLFSSESGAPGSEGRGAQGSFGLGSLAAGGASGQRTGNAVGAAPNRSRESQRARNLNQNAYRQAKEAFHNRAFVPQQFQVKKSDSLDYTVGDRVNHVKFGVGTVEAIVEGGRDYEVTVNFDRVGVKKMFAAFAKLKKV
ncbi:MAG: UvrD-helicase domain-containing protein [Lachnospiraceae bacterium]|nr:UvrD-helicase domain-containing protein [Lachnospiraceae bacterium]